MAFNNLPRRPKPDPNDPAFLEHERRSPDVATNTELAKGAPTEPEPSKPSKPSKARKRSGSRRRTSEPKANSPVLVLDGPTEHFSVRLPAALLDRARDLAAATDLTITDLIVRGMKAELEAKLALYRRKAGREVPVRTSLKLGD